MNLQLFVLLLFHSQHRLTLKSDFKTNRRAALEGKFDQANTLCHGCNKKIIEAKDFQGQLPIEVRKKISISDGMLIGAKKSQKNNYFITLFLFFQISKHFTKCHRAISDLQRSLGFDDDVAKQKIVTTTPDIPRSGPSPTHGHREETDGQTIKCDICSKLLKSEELLR